MEPKKLLTTLALVSVVLIAGCKKDTFVEIPGVCPEVISTDPANLATGVPLNKVITATFNKVMNPATITQASFTVKGASAITGTVSYTGTTASFVPSSPLTPNTTYTGTISKSVKDLIRQSPKYDYVWTFTTINPYTVAVSSNPLAGGTTSGSGTFISGSSVTVTAAANAGYIFTNWTESGAIVSTTTPYIFTISGNRTLVANYTARYTVAVSSNPLAGGTTTGSGTFNSGSSVTVTAVANTGYAFTNWTESGTIVSTTTPYIFTISGNRILVANYTAAVSSYTVTLSANPLAGGTQSGAGAFNSGASVTVTANPAVGYSFTYWTESGTIVSTAANYTFIISGNRILVANYANILYTVTVSANPVAGGTPSGGGTFNYGNSVTIKANPAVGYTFTNWTESGIIVSTTASYTFTISGNRILVANFTINTYTLTVTANNGSVVKNPNQTTYNYGTTVTLTPTPDTGYTFTSWSGDATGTANPLTVTMNANKAITANFTATASAFTLTVTATHGTVEKNPDQAAYNTGTVVTLTPTPESGYSFTSWSGDVTGSSNPSTVTMNADKNVTANFTLISAACPTIVDLGKSGDYVILAESGISTTGTTSITGNMGVYPLTSTAITGFGLILPAAGEFSTSSLVIGNIYAPDYAEPTPTNLNTAVLNMHTAYTKANDLVVPAPTTEFMAGNLNGETLYKGIYKWGTGVSITTGITLDGGGDNCATWIFQIFGDLTVANGAIIHLTNGANAKNIFWVVAGAKTEIGTTADFSGNILCKTLISLNNGAKITGRLLAQTAVTLIGSTVVVLP